MVAIRHYAIIREAAAHIAEAANGAVGALVEATCCVSVACSFRILVSFEPEDHSVPGDVEAAGRQALFHGLADGFEYSGFVDEHVAAHQRVFLGSAKQPALVLSVHVSRYSHMGSPSSSHS